MQYGPKHETPSSQKPSREKRENHVGLKIAGLNSCLYCKPCRTLNHTGGGVVFTTIHKLMPEKGEVMSEVGTRQNIVVIADEAHRSQYGFGGKVDEKAGEMSYGFASNEMYSLSAVSAQFGMSREGIRQAEARALGKLRKSPYANRLRGCYGDLGTARI